MFNVGDEVYIVDENNSAQYYKELCRIVEVRPNNDLVLFNLVTGDQKITSRFQVISKYIKGTGDPVVDEKIKTALQHYTATAQVNEANKKKLKELTDYQKELHASLASKFKELVGGITGLVDYTEKLEKRVEELEDPHEKSNPPSH